MQDPRSICPDCAQPVGMRHTKNCPRNTGDNMKDANIVRKAQRTYGEQVQPV